MTKPRRPPRRDVSWIAGTDALARVAQPLGKLVWDSVRLHSALAPKEAGVRIGASKLGGSPDLPKGMAWPTGELPVGQREREIFVGFDRVRTLSSATVDLSFVAQIALADLPEFKDRKLLPKTGTLAFFYDPDSYYEKVSKPANQAVTKDVGTGQRWASVAWADPYRVRVFHFDELLARVKPADHAPRWAACSGTTMVVEPTLPDRESVRIDRLALRDEEARAYSEMQSEQNANRILHQLLGHAAYMQPYAAELSYRISHPRLFPDETRLPDKLGTPFSDSFMRPRLLLQVGSNETGMEFGRSGRLYFFIREDDLASHDFSRVWAYEQ